MNFFTIFTAERPGEVIPEFIEVEFDGEVRRVPLAERYHPDFISQLVPYDPENPPALPAGPELPVEARIAALRTAVQAHLDAPAQALGYDDIKTAITYADEPAVPRFQAEGRALRAWRSRVWDRCYGVLAQWEAGEIPEPSESELIQMLPALDLQQ